ncbi:hypothetical protein X777_03210, partial [Ooceraea biroi]
ALSSFVRGEIQSLSILVRSEIQSATFHCAMVTMQFLQLTLHGFAVTFSRSLGECPVHRVTLGEILTPRIRYVVLAARCVQRIYTRITSG